MLDCIFCKIVKGDIPAYKVYEDAKVLAFLDVKPHTKGHTVVVPKNHAVRIFDLDDKEAGELFVSVRKVMDLLDKKLNPDGFNVGWNHNTAGGQVVPHLHVHIMPRYINDGGGSMHSIIKNPGKISVEEVAQLFK
ncbi:HIT family protein [Candidatus Woesearchaeota archaeon]|nr:HIT family protein [Candidatus Woesearchaeota archaeon]